MTKLERMNSEYDKVKKEYDELDKYNKIVKGELTQSKQQLEKLYTNSDKIYEQISYGKPIYDKIGLGYSIFSEGKKSNLEDMKDPTIDKTESSIEVEDLSKIEETEPKTKKESESKQEDETLK